MTSVHEDSEKILLNSPIRGQLKTKALAKDGLTISEESCRIDLIRYLSKNKCPKQYIAAETIVIQNLGESGRNELCCDQIIYDSPITGIAHLALKEHPERTITCFRSKSDANKKSSAIQHQLEPTVLQSPGVHVPSIYWDNINRILLN